jgi:hypothetical protein
MSNAVEYEKMRTFALAVVAGIVLGLIAKSLFTLL